MPTARTSTKSGSRPRSLNDDSEEAALWTDSHSIWSPFDAGDPPESRATVAFTVDFAHFTDKEILGYSYM